MENLEKLVQDETWDIEEASQNNVLNGSMQYYSSLNDLPINKHGPAITQPSIAPSVVPAAPVAPVVPVVTNSASLGLASGEDVLTRPAALRRGAATTWFTRFHPLN